jgi:cell division protein FtsZ
LNSSKAPIKFQLGSKLTRGLGAGANPEVGRDAALEDHEKLLDVLEGSDMVFVTTGLGGGTEPARLPVVASLAIELGALTVAVVTKPFNVEGKKRMTQAERGLAELRGCVDTIITIPNSKLREVEEKITIMDAFRRADEILLQAVQGITDLITTPASSTSTFADVTTVMKNRGVALMGIRLGERDLTRRRRQCAPRSITNCSKKTRLSERKERSSTSPAAKICRSAKSKTQFASSKKKPTTTPILSGERFSSREWKTKSK